MTPSDARSAVTDPPAERPERSDRPRRPAEIRLERTGRTTRRLALAALVVACVGLGLAAYPLVMPPAQGCQAITWDTAPAIAELPLGWTVGATQYDTGRKTMTFLGPAPTDSTTQRAVLYATVTCFAQGAADSVVRSADAARAAGQVVTQRQDLGEQAYSAADKSGATFVQFRRGAVVVYLAASGDTTPAEADAVAAAFDHAMGGPAPQLAVGTPDAGTSGAVPSPVPSVMASAGASASPAAPDLEAALPKSVGTITLTVQSALGPAILGTDQGSRAITAALRAEGKSPSDLRIAQAYDASGQADLTMLAIAVTGMSTDSMKALVLDSWLAASGAGVKTTTVTLSGRTFTQVDYGDNGTKDYLLVEQGRVVIIETATADLATQAAAALP